MIPKKFRGSPPSPCADEILAVISENEGISIRDIRRLLRYRYCPRTVQKYLAELRIAKKVECYVLGNMRVPLYRLVRE
jgi:hypothetical protein